VVTPKRTFFLIAPMMRRGNSGCEAFCTTSPSGGPRPQLGGRLAAAAHATGGNMMARPGAALVRQELPLARQGEGLRKAAAKELACTSGVASAGRGPVHSTPNTRAGAPPPPPAFRTSVPPQAVPSQVDHAVVEPPAVVVLYIKLRERKSVSLARRALGKRTNQTGEEDRCMGKGDGDT
jgi:hypothetical protein